MDQPPDDRVARMRQELFGDTLTVPEAATVLGLERSTILRYLRDGVLHGFKIGRRYRVTVESVREYVSHTKHSNPPTP